MKHIRVSQSKLWLIPLVGILLSVALIAALLPQNVLAQTGTTESSTTTTSTSPASPTIKTVTPTTNVTTNSADLRGDLENMGGSTEVQVYFVYGPTTAYGSSSATQNMASTGYFSIHIQGLTASTTYHYQVLAVNTTGEGQGADVTFTTLGATSSTTTSSTITTSTAITTTTAVTSSSNTTVKTVTPTANVTDNSADLRGDLESMDSSSEMQVYFVYGLTTAYGSSSATENMTSTGFFTIHIQGLTPSTTYHYQVIAADDNGKYQGADVTFTTLSGQTVIPTTTTTTIPSPIITAPPIVTTTTATAVTPTPPTVQPPAVTTAEADPGQNTSLQSADGKITLTIPQGAVSTASDIEMDEYGPQQSDGTVILSRFDLTGKDKTSGIAFSKFNQNLQITIQNTPSEVAGIDPNSIKLYYLDTTTKQWVPVASSQFDPITDILTATTNHFTNYGEQGNSLIVGPGAVMAAQVGLQSGTSTFSYPFVLPPGPGGFQPKLTLSYNSGSVDEMKDKRDTGSWVGIGWSLDFGSINYNLSANTYSMEINGVSYQLITSDNVNYHTNPEHYYKITRSGNTWNVYDTSGNFYRFGGTTDSQQYLSGYVYYRWDLSQMADTNDNTANISYLQDVEGSSPNSWVRSAYPASMTYGSMQVVFNSSYDQHSSTDGYLRNDDPVSYGSNPAPEVMDNARLNSIAIKVSGTLIRQYNFTYNTTNSSYSSDYGGIYYAGTFTLASLTQIGSDGTSQMPTMTFSYQSLQTYYQDTTSLSYSGNPGNPASFTWPHLTVVNNGYGGSTTFTYTEIPNSSTTNIWTREAVTQKTVSPGIGPNQTTQYAYSGNPYYFGTGWTEQFRGWNQVTETDAAGNYIIHWFYTTGTINGNDAEKLTGNEYQTQWYSSSGTLLDTKTYTWNWTQTGQYSGPPYQAVTPSSVTSWNVISPAAIAVSPTGNVYIGTASNLVAEFTSSGASVTSWIVSSPSGIAVSPTGNVYVCSTSNNLVTEWTSGGGSVASWAVNSPTAIAVSSIGIVYVCSAAGNIVTEWTSNGGSVTSWAVSSPTGIAVSPNGNVYVCSTSGNVVTEWTSNGSSVTSWAVTSPTGIAVLSTGNVFACSTGGNVVTEWTGTGSNVTSWTVTSPNGVAASSTGDIYSCSNAGNSVGEYLVATPTVYPAYSVYMSQVDDTVGNKTSQTRYSYDSYGNVITEYDDGDISTTADDSTIWRVYNPNTSTNVLDKPARVRTYATAMSTDNGGGNLKQETDYYYDGQSNSAPPTKGNLTSEVQWINSSSSITTSYVYDTYGNKISETDGNGKPTTWTYDSTYHTYPATMTDPITSLTESYTYDPGTNNILTTTGLNEETTYDYYDPFKRLSSVVKPGDSQSSPSIIYKYNSWGTQNSQNVETITKIDSGAGDITWSTDYFDGLGRVIQTQTQSQTLNHTTISSTTVYNNCGEVAQQYVSQDIASNLSAYYTTGISGWKYTGYTYDGMGRVLTQTNPDGTVTTNNYSTPWQTTTTDANGVNTVDVYDAFSRLIQVQNLPGATVVTNTTSSVGNTTATLNGTLTVLGNASSATVSFQYGTTTAYGSAIAGTPSPLSAAGTFSANLTGLTVGTTYHFRTEAVAGTATVYGADQSFVTTGGSTAPTVTSAAATNVSSTWATLNGNVSNLGSAASDTVSFDYGTTTSYGNNITAAPSPMTATGSFCINLTGLTPGTVYHYRAKATGNGTTNGSDQQFTTSTGTPVVITQSVATGADDGFAGSGTFDNSDTWYEVGQPYNAWFRFTGITIPAGATIVAAHLILIEGSWGSGTSLKISADNSQNPTAPTSQSNLASKTRTSTNVYWTSGYSDYQWHNSPDFTTVIQQLVNSFTYSNGAIQILVDNNNSSSGAELAGSTFEDGYAPQLYIQYQTSGGSSTTPPSVSTSAASSVGSSTVTLNGSLTGLGSAANATVSFEYGTTTNYGNTAAGSPSSLSSTGTFTANLTGLAPSTTYHYCSEAVGSATTFGPDQQFTTTSSGSSTVAFTQSVATAADNGFAGSGIFDNSDTWYEVGQPYSAWFRFTGITIPAGATILAAHLTLIEGDWDSGTSLTISADDSQSPVAPTSQSDLASKTRTSTGVAWTSGSSDYQWHNSPDFTSVIQQLVNGFTYNNGAIQILVDNNNSSSGAELVGSTFENTGYAPELYIQYQTSGGTASAIVTNYTYDVLGNMTSATDNNGNSTYMTYDWLSRKTGMTDPDMGSWSYTYDADGNLVSQTDAKNQTITMVYDAMDRLTNKNYPSGSGMTNIVYSYDGNGNNSLGLLTGMTDASGTTSYSYDTRGQLTAETKTINSTPYTTDYTYDGLGRVVTITYPNPNGTPETVTNTYNAGGLPSTVSSSAVGNLVTGTTYNQLGDISEIDLNNGVKTTYGYYGTGGTNDTTGGYYGQLWQIKSASQSTTMQDIQYTWDADGNLTQQQNLVSGQTENFTYDALDRLSTASGAYSQTYTYDALGNITSMTNNGNTQFYSYGAQPDAVTQVGSTSYTYDANGNMTNRGIQIITWNVDNQPATISGGTSFVYDGKGNRVEETTGGQTTVYINQYYQKNITTGVVTTYYYLGSQLVAQNTGSTLRYVGQDNVGSTSTMTTSTGTLDSSISYYPFGAVESGSVNTVKQFTGQILDSTGLYYYNARYYDPTIGRFISADTVLQNYDNPQTLNRYSYCQNNPLTYNDPTGHFAIFAAMAIGAAIGAAVNVGIYAVQHRGSYTGEGFAKAALTGAVSGALAVIPIPGLQILASSLITGAVSGITSWAVGTAMDDVTGNYNQSESSLPAMIASGLGGAVGGSVGTIIGSIATPLAGSLGQQSTLAGSIGQQLTQDSYQALTTNTGRDFTVSTLASAVPSSLAGQISSNIIDPDYQSNSQTPQSGGTYNVTGPVVAFQWWLYDPDGE